jgi:acyl-CoA synthetase (AMP-forming)/AMP-acid ligase II
VDESGEARAGADEGWFYPGDLGSIDVEGFLSLRGREKDVIVRGGVNVYPAEVERALCAHPQVREAAVIGVPSGTHGEAIVACVAPAGGATDEELMAHCRERLAPYKLPVRLLRFETLPKSGSGKTDKQALRRIAAGA